MKRSACFIIAFLCISSFTGAQTIETALQEQFQKHAAEKLYIHYDKDYYAAGETAWFKAYLYINGQPSDKSNNFYLQLTDGKGSVLITQKYPVKGSTVSGNIPLPDTLSEGTYFIRAVTPYMLNEDPSFHYFKPFFVFNPSRKTTPAPVFPVSTPAVRFFPEGGSLTEDLLSVVAFTSTDETGRPVEISGTIRTDDTVTVASFKTSHNGMGKFQFKPRPGKKYIAAVVVNGNTSFYPLPEANPSGIGLKVENEAGGKAFTISRSRKDKDTYAKLRLLAQMNSRIIYDTEIEFENFYQVKGHLLTDSMPSGILHFTLFSENGQPLAERLSFVDNKEYISKGNIALQKTGTGIHAGNIIDVQFTSAAQRSLSVSVTDPSVSSFAGKDNIISALLLTGDLRGTIWNPASFFLQENDSVAANALDYVMLTNGWSRFSWKKILAGDFPDKKINDQYLIEIPGIVTDSKTKTPVSGGLLSVFLESADSVNQHFDLPVDNKGHFTLDSLLIRGTTKLFYAYTNAAGTAKTVDISLFTIPPDSAVARMEIDKATASVMAKRYTGLFSSPEIKVYAPEKKSKLDETKTLDPVVLKPKEYKRPIDEINDKYTSGVFTSMGRTNFDNINQPENDRSLSVYDFARRSIKQINEQDGEFVNRRNFDLFENPTPAQLIKYDKSRDSTRTATIGAGSDDNFFNKLDYKPGKNFVVGIYLNETPAYVGILKTIRMDQVALIKFYEPGFIGSGATESPGGVLSVYTKKYEPPKGELEKLDNTTYEGYTLVKEFFSPDYATVAGTNPLPDNRTTLYWNPSVYTGSGVNSIQLKFFHNDRGGKYKIVVEGFDNAGKLVHLEKLVDN